MYMGKTLVVSGLVIVLLIMSIGMVSADDYPMFKHDVNRSSHADSVGSDDNRAYWTYPASGSEEAGPVVTDGKLYMGTENGLICLDAYDGTEIWTLEDTFFMTPTVENGRVYIAAGEGAVENLYCLNADNGDIVWVSQVDMPYSSPAVVDGKIYIGSRDDNVYCLDADNGDNIIWFYQANGFVDSSPAVVSGKVYVGSDDDNIYCLNADNGDLIWAYDAGGNIRSSPAVVGGKVYVGAEVYPDNNFFCLNANDGNLIWNYETYGNVKSSPAVANGKVYVASEGGYIYSFDANSGDNLWEYNCGAAAYSPTVDNSDKIYFGAGSVDGGFYCLDNNGDLVWKYNNEDPSNHWTPVSIANGMVYVSSWVPEGDTLYCFASVLIYIRWEDNYALVKNVESESLELWVYKEEGREKLTIDSNPYVISSELYSEARLIELWDNANYHRSRIPPHPPEDLDFFIVDDPSELGEYVFILVDLTGKYGPSYEGWVSARKYIGDELAAITEDYWGANEQAILHLTLGDVLYVYVGSNISPLRLVGPIRLPSTAANVTIKVFPVITELDQIFDDVYWAAWRESDNIIRVEYQDNLDNTTGVRVEIYDMEDNLMAEYQPDNEWFIVTWTGADENESYNVVLEVEHGIYGDFTINTPIGSTEGPPGVEGTENPFDLPPGLTLAALGSIILITVIGLSFDALRASLGVLGIAMTTLFCWYMGFLPLPGPYNGLFTAVLILFIAVLFVLTWRRRK